MSFAPPRGMRDFYPEQFRHREALFRVWHAVSQCYGFEGYDAPVVETEELLMRKGGEEIARQIYCFEDKSGRRLALRPEMTPSLARMIISRQGSLQFPLKWYAIAQCFRYERMTRGRKREHFQWNLDIVGDESILAEIEVIGAAIESMRRLGLGAEDFRVRVGSRALLGLLFERSAIAREHFAACCLALDKRDKISEDQTRTLLSDEGLGTKDIDRVFDLMALKTLDQAAQSIGEEAQPILELRRLFDLAGEAGFARFLDFDASIVRGLGYYTGIVFEAFDARGELRAIFGGGRYDNLLSDLGGQRCTAVGLGFGDVVILELLTMLDKLPDSGSRIDYAIGFMNDACRAMAIRAARGLREKGQSADLALRPEKPKKFFARADRIKASYSILIGPDELEAGEIALKDMSTGEQKKIALDAL